MRGPGTRLGPGGNSRQTTGSRSPWSTRARVNMANDASLAKEKEMQSVFKSFKPSLKASWTGVWVWVRHVLPSGTARLWDLPAFLQEAGGDKKHLIVVHPHLNIKKPQTWLNKSEIDHSDFPLAHTVNFLHHRCKNKLYESCPCRYSSSNELTDTFSVLLEGLQMLCASHSLQKLLISALQNIKKGIEFSFSQEQ